MATETPSRKLDIIVSLLLFLFVSSVYYATVSGITSSNDGSHYALLRTMVENRAFTLNQFDDYAEGNDIALTPDGRLFSDRPPGTAVTTIPFHLIGKYLPSQPLPSRHDADNPRLPTIMLWPVFAGASTVFLLYWLLRGFSISRPASLTASLFFAFGTAHWKYSTVLFSHAISAFLIMLTVYLTIQKFKIKDSKLDVSPSIFNLQSFFLGFVLGLSVLVEYSNALLVVIVGLYLLARLWKTGQVVRFLLFFIAGGLPSILFLAYYNTVNFGGPLTVSYAFAVNYPWAGEFGSTFSFPLGAGLKALLYYGESGGWCGGTCYNQGLFLLSPIMLTAVPGFYFYGKRERGAFTLTTTIFVVYLLLFAKHHTSHGFTADGRYLVPFLSLLAIPLGFMVDEVLRWRQRPLLQLASSFILFGLFFVSAGNMFIHIGTSYNYHLDLALLDQMIASPQNYQYMMESVFRNGRNLPLLWLIEAITLAFIALGVVVWKRQTTQQSTA